jgi:hypothetical protein
MAIPQVTDQTLEDLKRIILEKKAFPLRVMRMFQDHDLTMTEIPELKETDQEHLHSLIQWMLLKPTRPSQLVAAGTIEKMEMPPIPNKWTSRRQVEVHLEGVISPKSRPDHRCPVAEINLHLAQLHQTKNVMVVHPVPEPVTLNEMEMASTPIAARTATSKMASKIAMQMERTDPVLKTITLTLGP